jgi:hypothetical protein
MEASSTSAGSVIGGIILIAFLIVAYFLPLIVAALRHVPNVGSVAIVNFFLGWTFIGWVVAMAMACRSADRSVIVQYGAPAPPAPQAAPLSPAGWFADPSARHELRYWDGMRWSDHVSNAGVSAVDPA